MKVPYQCPYCDQRSTRRWNLDVHIKRKHGGLIGRSPDRSMANNPQLYNKRVQFGYATVGNGIDDTFHPTFLPQQAVPGTSQYSANSIYPYLDVSQTFASPMYQPIPAMQDKSYGTGLSQDAIRKIDELRRLMNKYPKYHMNPNGIIQWAIHRSINGDDAFLDGKLEQLHSIDRLTKYYPF